MMLRRVYSWIVRLHPARFRDRFGDEMLSIFDDACDEASHDRSSPGLFADGISSLLRQWILRAYHETQPPVEPAPSPAGGAGIPGFYVIDDYRPQTSSLLSGGILTLALFSAVWLVSEYTWTHPVFMPLVTVQFDQPEPYLNAPSPSVVSPLPLASIPSAGDSRLAQQSETPPSLAISSASKPSEPNSINSGEPAAPPPAAPMKITEGKPPRELSPSSPGATSAAQPSVPMKIPEGKSLTGVPISPAPSRERSAIPGLPRPSASPVSPAILPDLLRSYLATTTKVSHEPTFEQSQSAPPPSYRFSSGAAAINIPLELVADGLVFVRANINDHPGWFILDNAVQGFTVDRTFARQIALQTSGTAVARAGGPNTIEATIVRNARISLPGLDLTHRNLVVIELKPIESAVGHEIDGIIGSRLFDDFVVAIDYERRSLSIYFPPAYQPPDKESPLPVRLDEHGFEFVDATITLPGLQPITANFLIDGGANTFADVYKPFSDAHQIPPPAMRLLDDPGTSAGGTTQSRDGRADRISIGPYSVINPPITFAQDTQGLLAAKEYAGLIGGEFLQRFTLVLDSPGKRIWLKPNRSYARPAEYDQSGLRLRAEGPAFHKFTVNRVVPHSPAQEAAIQPEDVIESIDHHPADRLTLTELRSILRQPKNDHVIEILRGDQHLRIVLHPRPLL